MTIVTLADAKAQLNITDAVDDTLIAQKLEAAQNHIERLLGFEIATQYPTDVPAALKEAVLQLASWWFEQREAGITGTIVNTVPYSVQDIVTEYRNWSFGDAE
ncbi:MAG: head-tail connector protein [Pseudomonadota bacterium]